MGGKSSSSSSSSNATTQTVNEDNRVGADGGAVALGKDAILQINNEFPDQVVQTFSELIDFAKEAGNVVVNATNQSVSSAEKALDTVAKNIENTSKIKEQGQNTIITDFFPIIGIAIVAFALVQIFKKGR